MKKTLLLLGAVVFSFGSAFAQDIVIKRPADNDTGLISTEGDNGAGIYSADYFVLEDETTLGEFYFYGFNNEASPDDFVLGFNLYIFKHDETTSSPNGSPVDLDNAVVRLANIGLDKFQTDMGWNFIVNATVANNDTDIVLPAGEYWVSASPIVQGAANGNGSWYWIGNVTSGLEHGSMLIDPTDVIGAGVSDWAPISALIGEEFNALAWRLTDGGILGVEDFETNSFKHLVKNNQLLISSDLEINNVAIYNSLGQKVASQSVNATSANINLSNLSSGVYFTQADVNGEVKTFKFAK